MVSPKYISIPAIKTRHSDTASPQHFLYNFITILIYDSNDNRPNQNADRFGNHGEEDVNVMMFDETDKN